MSAMTSACPTTLVDARFQAQVDRAADLQDELEAMTARGVDAISGHKKEMADFAAALWNGDNGIDFDGRQLEVLLKGLIYPTPSKADGTPGSHEAAVELAHNLMRQYAAAVASEELERNLRRVRTDDEE